MPTFALPNYFFETEKWTEEMGQEEEKQGTGVARKEQPIRWVYIY